MGCENDSGAPGKRFGETGSHDLDLIPYAELVDQTAALLAIEAQGVALVYDEHAAMLLADRRHVSQWTDGADGASTGW